VFNMQMMLLGRLKSCCESCSSFSWRAAHCPRRLNGYMYILGETSTYRASIETQQKREAATGANGGPLAQAQTASRKLPQQYSKTVPSFVRRLVLSVALIPSVGVRKRKTAIDGWWWCVHERDSKRNKHWWSHPPLSSTLLFLCVD